MSTPSVPAIMDFRHSFKASRNGMDCRSPEAVMRPSRELARCRRRQHRAAGLFMQPPDARFQSCLFTRERKWPYTAGPLLHVSRRMRAFLGLMRICVGARLLLTPRDRSRRLKRRTHPCQFLSQIRIREVASMSPGQFRTLSDELCAARQIGSDEIVCSIYVDDA